MNKHNEAYKAALRRAQWEAEQNRPYDWQDKLVIAGSVISIFAVLAIVAWGKL